jgi:hypothetical protein
MDGQRKGFTSVEKSLNFLAAATLFVVTQWLYTKQMTSSGGSIAIQGGSPH